MSVFTGLVQKFSAFIFGAGDGNLSRHCRAYRLAFARCRVAQTVHRTVCYCSLFDSHPYREKEKSYLKAQLLFLERVMGIEPTYFAL